MVGGGLFIFILLLFKTFSHDEDCCFNKTFTDEIKEGLEEIKEKILCSCYNNPSWEFLFLDSFLTYISCPLTKTLENLCSCKPLDLYKGDCSCKCVDAICYEYNSTDSSVCSGHGNCIRTNQCLCLQGYFGNKCNENFIL